MNHDIPLPSVSEIIDTFHLQTNKKLGQHFIKDQNFIDTLVKKTQPPYTGTIIEVGPGPGGLTAALLRFNPTARIIAIEHDIRCVEALQYLKTAYPSRFTLIHHDALKVPLHTIASAPVQIISNLPYNIGTVLLGQWLEEIELIDNMYLMFQLEVAKMITAEPKNKAYGRLSVLLDLLCSRKIVQHVKAGTFSPPPKIVSAVVHLQSKKETIAPALLQTIKALLHTSFNMRRKMLRQSLKPFITPSMAQEFDYTQRPEDLSSQEFVELAKIFLSHNIQLQ